MSNDTSLGAIQKDGKIFSSGTIYYYIYGSPSSTDFRNTDFKTQIKEALACWERVSNFNFKELTDAESASTYPSFAPRINFRFGTLEGALSSAETSFEGKDAGNPRQIVFNDGKTWASMREKDLTVVEAIFGYTGTGIAAIAVNDLWTITMHEVGHALGLQHNNDPDSIMYPLDVQDEPHRPVMIEHAIPLIDALSLARIYGVAVEKPVSELPVVDSGFVIVGGKFVMYESPSMNTMPQTPRETLWGMDEGYLVQAGAGYCISPTGPVQARKGWGVLYFYVIEPEKVDPRALVAIGGFQMEAADAFQRSTPKTPAPSVATCVPDGRIKADTKSGVSWGGDWGDVSQGADQPIAHFYSYAYPAKYNYRVMFLKLHNGGPGGRRVTGGYQLAPGTSQPISRWGYSALGDVAQEIGRADRPDSKQSTVLNLWLR